MRTSRTFRRWSRFGRWPDKSARPELVEGRAVECWWFDRLTTSVGTNIGAQQTRPLPTFRRWSRFGRWADKSARPELVEGRAVECSWFDRLTTSVGTDIGAQQTRPLPRNWLTMCRGQSHANR